MRNIFGWLVAVWLFLHGVATIWPAISDKTIPAWLAERGWSVNLSANLFGWLSLLVGVLMMLVLAAGHFGWLSTSSRLTEAPTSLRLTFLGNGTTPHQTDNQNVWRWYALKNHHEFINRMNPAERYVSASWTIFLTFDSPIDPTSHALRVTFEGNGFPMHEVKDFTERSAVIGVFGEIPTGTMVIRGQR